MRRGFHRHRAKDEANALKAFESYVRQIKAMTGIVADVILSEDGVEIQREHVVLKDKAGNRLFRKVWVKIIYPDAIFPPKIKLSMQVRNKVSVPKVLTIF